MRAAPLVVLLAAVCVLFVTTPTYGLHVKGRVSSEDGFAYIGKFFFDFTPTGSPAASGTLQLKLEADKAMSSDITVLIYDDQPESWPEVYQKNIPCISKINKAKNFEVARGGVPVFFRAVWENGVWGLPEIPIHEHSRSREWVIVAGNCRGFEDLGYEIQFINRGGPWHRELGYDQQGLNTLYLVFALFYLCLLSIHAHGVQQSYARQGFVHPAVKLVTIVIGFQTLGVVAKMVHYLVFTENGVGTPTLDNGGDVFMAVARITFVFLLLLLANGWTISTDTIRNRSTIFAGAGALFFTYILLVVWSTAWRDPASTLYEYDSWPGYVLVVVDLGMAFWFQFTLYNSREEESNETKRGFYSLLWAIYGAWFFALPIIILLSGIVAPWVREKTVTGLELSVSTLAYSTMAYLMWHTRAEQYFAISTPDVKFFDDGGL